MSRRVSKTGHEWASNGWQEVSVSSFLYDGWLLVSEESASGGNITTNFYVWGLDLSGSLQGAGGVGGLLAVRLGTNNVAYSYDGNGNVSELTDASTGNVKAHYEYSPFGETLVSEGALAKDNPFRFSTKYTDDETAFVYYGYRYYAPGMGRWLSRDPLGEETFFRQYQVGKSSKVILELYAHTLTPLYLFIRNSLINNYDYLGLKEECCPQPPPSLSLPAIMNSGWDAEKKYFPEGGDPYGGAYRHCVSACNLVKKFGRLGGHAIRCIWDAYHENNSPDSISDKQGEDVGENVGKGDEPCDIGCLRHYPPLSD